MVSCSECYQVSIICWRGDRHRPSAAHVGVAELVGEQLKFVCSKTVIIPQYVIMRGTAGTLGRREQWFKQSSLLSKSCFYQIKMKCQKDGKDH